MITIWVIIVLLAAVGWLIYLFNTLVGLSNHADATWAEIDLQLKRRYELTGKLLEIAASNNITGTENLAAARAAAADAYTPSEKSRTEPAVTSATRSVLTTAAARLGSQEEFAQLQLTLDDIEDYLKTASHDYNRIAQELNDQTGAFPNNYAAPLFGVQPRELFQTDGDASATA